MDNYMDWLRKLQDDLIEQFRGQPKIAVFQKAVARQLVDLYAFYYQLYILQWLNQAEGAQLDGIGNIVDLSRTDALIWANIAGLNVPMNDELYRIYLMFKIFLNTSEGTYADVVRTLEMFWPDTPFYYSEYIDIPATMFFTSGALPMTTDLRILQIVTRVKAAGVALHFVAQAATEDTPMYFAAAVSGFLEAIIIDNPEIGGLTVDYSAAGAKMFTETLIINNPDLGGTTESRVAAAANFFKEVRIPE